ncbi:YihY/virulence factor BrkB family protein [Nocardioides terrisoli]|uniref:YihY/virulence factor BrkB family protein n=1 Tax=Nocardioides terrisoli TaxID=3388267 RepID=UPI00287BBB12|nr:YihY/virulence factor BrkB family protein [Nocardioides marmorisolisilvae]
MTTTTDTTPSESATMQSQDDDAVEGQETDFGQDESFDRRSVWYVLRKTVREFADDRCTDLAAALTYFSVLAIFPATLALLSLLGVFGQGDKSLNVVLKVISPLVSASTLQNIQGPLERLANSEAAGWTLVVGLVGALWSASAYVGAFGRAMNRIYEVEEGRPFWRLRPMNLLVTLASVVLCAVALVILVVSGRLATAIGDQIGLGDQAVTAWSYAKWPVLALVVVAVVAILYHFTPNVRTPKLRVLSVGAFVAILVWIAASVGFAFYVANFSSYDKTYGSVAGVVIALLWLWLTNLALLFGAELDTELERARELHRGLAAEEQLQLPMRSERGIVRAAARREKDAARGRAIREARVGAGDPTDRPF